MAGSLPLLFSRSCLRGSHIRLPMIHAAPQTLHLDLNRVKLAIFCRRAERDTVFVPHQLGNFRIGTIKFLLILGEIDAPTGSQREFVQQLVGLSKTLLYEFSILGLLRQEFPQFGVRKSPESETAKMRTSEILSFC